MQKIHLFVEKSPILFQYLALVQVFLGEKKTLLHKKSSHCGAWHLELFKIHMVNLALLVSGLYFSIEHHGEDFLSTFTR